MTELDLQQWLSADTSSGSWCVLAALASASSPGLVLHSIDLGRQFSYSWMHMGGQGLAGGVLETK